MKTDCFIPWTVISSENLSLAVFVTSKNETYIYITNEVTTLPKVPISECQVTESHSSVEPIYENIETGNILPSDDNKFKIYVNYDFLSKSNVRLLEPDIIQITELGESLTETDSYQTSVKSEKNDVDYRTISKTMQCQQISMYIGEFTYSRQLRYCESVTLLNPEGIRNLSKYLTIY